MNRLAQTHITHYYSKQYFILLSLFHHSGGCFLSLILTYRHTLSYHCGSWQRTCIQTQENRSYEEFLFLLLLISRHHSCSPTVSSVHCFFHTQFITSLLAVPSTENKSLHQDHRFSYSLRSSEMSCISLTSNK